MVPCASFHYNSVSSPTSCTASAYTDSLKHSHIFQRESLAQLKLGFQSQSKLLRAQTLHGTHVTGTQGTAKWEKKSGCKAEGMSLVSRIPKSFIKATLSKPIQRLPLRSFWSAYY